MRNHCAGVGAGESEPAVRGGVLGEIQHNEHVLLFFIPCFHLAPYIFPVCVYVCTHNHAAIYRMLCSLTAAGHVVASGEEYQGHWQQRDYKVFSPGSDWCVVPSPLSPYPSYHSPCLSSYSMQCCAVLCCLVQSLSLHAHTHKWMEDRQTERHKVTVVAAVATATAAAVAGMHWTGAQHQQCRRCP